VFADPNLCFLLSSPLLNPTETRLGSPPAAGALSRAVTRAVMAGMTDRMTKRWFELASRQLFQEAFQESPSSLSPRRLRDSVR
jgi:hypothetical protein